MELHSLQEALKVEIQCHQNGDLKKQIHERQARIAALNEKQKLAVRSRPAALLVGSGASGSAKPGGGGGGGVPALLKAPGGGGGSPGGSPAQNLAISVVPAKAPIAMVTAHLNGGLGGVEPPQSSPINLQTPARLATARRPPDFGSRAQTLGTITAVPIKVPQVSSLQRLAGQGPAVLPQVRPKTLIPDSLPISPCRDQPSKQPPTFQKATVVSIKNPSPALPTANNTVSHVQTPNSQSQSITEPTPLSSPLSSAGVAYAIISTSPNNATPISTSTTVSMVNDSVKVQPLLISADSKVIIIQPQVQTQTESKVETKKLPEEPAQGCPATKKKKEENPEKIAFMVALGLVTTEHLEEIQSKRQERKRRSTANPAYSGLLETERKRLASNYLNNPLFLSTRANEDPFWKNEIHHDEHCTACKRGVNLQPCGTCPRAYHLNCLDPPLKTAPKGVWVCPKCQQKVLKKDDNVPWTGTLAIVHSYVTHKTVKEEEKQKLLKRSSELKSEHRQLEEKDRLLNNAVKQCLELKNSLLAQQKGTQSSLERLKTLIRLIQNEQMIQVTMTTTTTSSLLTVPWIKPSSASAAMHKALQQSQGNN
ncbi:PHD finger protein 21B isoform X1 [Anas platyrhynchos]|uniref:PHD finger protein 21B isoform X1 n=1 Tax=Anas platyrhynchos TaxID=8839 RepID=UPI000F7C79D9|nr:PHD finger protein 21B isoform X1 [Anas platyrhynchos]|eukprot:XP_027306675.1 PHD finger protein 21B isoform X2 [Anas platyrhynchos]